MKRKRKSPLGIHWSSCSPAFAAKHKTIEPVFHGTSKTPSRSIRFLLAPQPNPATAHEKIAASTSEPPAKNLEYPITVNMHFPGRLLSYRVLETNELQDGLLAAFDSEGAKRWEVDVMSTDSGIRGGDPFPRDHHKPLFLELELDDRETQILYWGVNSNGMFLNVYDVLTGKLTGRLYFGEY